MIFKEESQLMQNIKLGHLYRVYLLYGEEKYLKEMYLKKLVKLAAPQGLEEFNLHRFDAGQMEVDDLIESARRCPMMAQQRCVVVEKFDFEALNAQDKAKVTELLEDPPETTVLLLVVDKEDFLPQKERLCQKTGGAVRQGGRCHRTEKTGQLRFKPLYPLPSGAEGLHRIQSLL